MVPTDPVGKPASGGTVYVTVNMELGPKLTDEVQEVVGVPGDGLDGSRGKMVTVTGVEAPPTGAVIMVDHASGLPEPGGTVTVRTTVAVWSGPSGMVTVISSTDPELPGTPAVGASGGTAMVSVVPTGSQGPGV